MFRIFDIVSMRYILTIVIFLSRSILLAAASIESISYAWLTELLNILRVCLDRFARRLQCME